MIKSIFEKIIFNRFIVSLYNYYKKTFSIDLQKNHLLDKVYQEVANETYNIFEKEIKNSVGFLTKLSQREHAIKECLSEFSSDDLFLECGVFQGNSINLFAKHLSTKNLHIYGFDSFKGFIEDWHGSHLQKGSFSTSGKKPKVLNNVTIIEGYIEETLENFLNEKKLKIKFLHLDMDLFSATEKALIISKKYLKKGSIILMDDFANYPGFNNGPYLAFNQNFSKDDYEILSFGLYRSSSVLIKIIKDIN